MGIVKDVFGPTIVYNDSQAMIAYVKDLKYHGRTKHIATKNNFIRDIIAQNDVIDATHGSLALKAYQQNLYLKYYY